MSASFASRVKCRDQTTYSLTNLLKRMDRGLVKMGEERGW